jgi:transcriptional regulator with XRE-family HTH domain
MWAINNMTKVNKISQSPPAAVERILFRIGQNIKTARLRRNMRLEDLALRVGVSRYLISDIEKGKPTTSIAAYIGALWALGLSDDLYNIGNPDKDSEGKALENIHAPKTAGKRKKDLDNDF